MDLNKKGAREMEAKRKLAITLLSMFVIFFMSFSNYQGKPVNSIVSDFEGEWNIFFYDMSGKLHGNKTITISEDGTFTGKTNLSIDNVIYPTEISGTVAKSGKILDGKLINADKQDMVGTFDGNFIETEGNGNWGSYSGNFGTWKAEKITTPDRKK